MKRTKRKRRTSWIDVTFSIVLIILSLSAVFLAFIYIKNGNIQIPSSEKNTASSPTVVEAIDSNYPGIKIITETSNDKNAPFAIQYPQSIHSSFNEMVSTYIKNAKRDYITAMMNDNYADVDLVGELNISFETIPHHSGNYSFVLVNNSYLGGSNGKTEIRSYHLDPMTGNSITIEDVFEHDQIRLNYLSSIVRESLYNDPSMKNFLYLEEAHIKTEPLWVNYANFAITDDTLIFYFNEYEIASAAAGAPIVAIPLADLGTLLATEFNMREENISKPEIDNQLDDEKIVESPDKNRETQETEESNTFPEDTDGEIDVTTPPFDPTIKRVALTFDDGPDPKVTRQILATLNKYNAKATFFMLGSRVEFYSDIAVEINDAGHELGNHTWTHSDLTKASVEKIRNEISKTSSIIENVTGQQATVFRPPYGAVNKTVVFQTDLPVVLWDVDTLDWKHRNPIQLLENVKQTTKDGSIILMHDIHQSTADGLDSILAYLQSEGYIFVTVSELNQQFYPKR